MVLPPTILIRDFLLSNFFSLLRLNWHKALKFQQFLKLLEKYLLLRIKLLTLRTRPLIIFFLYVVFFLSLTDIFTFIIYSKVSITFRLYLLSVCSVIDIDKLIMMSLQNRKTWKMWDDIKSTHRSHVFFLILRLLIMFSVCDSITNELYLWDWNWMKCEEQDGQIFTLHNLLVM